PGRGTGLPGPGKQGQIERKRYRGDFEHMRHREDAQRVIENSAGQDHEYHQVPVREVRPQQTRTGMHQKKRQQKVQTYGKAEPEIGPRTDILFSILDHWMSGSPVYQRTQKYEGCGKKARSDGMVPGRYQFTADGPPGTGRVGHLVSVVQIEIDSN